MIKREHPTLTGSTGAVFSDCERYRYRLWREWDSRLPKLCFIMLNPSTADEQTNDPTITRCEARAVDGGFGRLEVVNLFPWRATDPDELARAEDPVGPSERANCAMMYALEHSTMIICAWGAHKFAAARAADVCHMLAITGYANDLYHLGLNQDGSPKHPLYVAKAIKPMRFVP